MLYNPSMGEKAHKTTEEKELRGLVIIKARIWDLKVWMLTEKRREVL